MTQKRLGMANVAFDAYVAAARGAKIDIDTRKDRRIVQTEGDAPASKGVHAKDGILDGGSYSAAVDISVRGLTKTQIATWVEWLTRAGFVAWFRNWEGNEHIHAIYCGVPMKPVLQSQAKDFFAGKDGLVGHRRADHEYWFPSQEVRSVPEKLFKVSNLKSSQSISSPLVNTSPPARVTNALYLNKETAPRLQMPVIDGVSMAPVREFGELTGQKVVYDPETRKISYNGEEIPLPVDTISGKAYAPVRMLAAEVGWNIAFDAAKRSVRITK